MPVKQWQCGMCGAWVNSAYMRHHHVALPSESLDEMIRAREAGIDATVPNTVTYTRTGAEPTREVTA